MKIYTKTGDTGDTSLYGGKRISKADLKIDTYGTVDELNSHIGLVKDVCDNNQSLILKEIQEQLFSMGAILATPEGKVNTYFKEIDITPIETLEKQIDLMNEDLPDLDAFILPGGHVHVSYCHIARTVCRRAERLAVALSKNETINSLIIIYLNRLSDYLFVLSRKLAKDLYVEEIKWLPKK
jgi:cob(I)alamin adenosyltransferase